MPRAFAATWALHFGLWAGVMTIGSGCVADASTPLDQSDISKYPTAGLFTPGNTLGAMAVAENAATAGDAPMNMTDVYTAEGDRCVGTAGPPGTPGTLMVQFTTEPTNAKYTPKNAGAIWVEDAQGNYMKTINAWVDVRGRDLWIWLLHSCKEAATEPDAITSATLPDHTKPHMATWDMKDLHGTLVPDGTYSLNIEMTESGLTQGPYVSIPFEKGTTPVTLMPPDEAAFKGLQITYTPKP